MANKALALIIIICLLGVVSVMTLLGTQGSIVVFSLLSGMAQWAPLIALGFSLGIFFMFLPKLKGKF